VQPLLLDPSAAALNQDDQHENKKNAGSNPNNRCCVHRDTPFRVFGSILPTVRNIAGFKIFDEW
jgi:hypothetical protein